MITDVYMPNVHMYHTDEPHTDKPVGTRVVRERRKIGRLSGIYVSETIESETRNVFGRVIAAITDERFIAFITDDGTEWRDVDAIIAAAFPEELEQER